MVKEKRIDSFFKRNRVDCEAQETGKGVAYGLMHIFMFGSLFYRQYESKYSSFEKFYKS
jgi:hypothetical protein